jgi:hypothetical protein
VRENVLSKCPIQESKRLKKMWESCAVMEAFLNYGSTLSNAKKTQVSSHCEQLVNC